MKNLLRTKNPFFMFLMLAIAFAGCVKKDDFYKKNSNESNRKQVVQIIGADDLIQYARDVKSTNDTFVLIDIRRYPNTEAELNQPLTVKLVKNPTLIADFNATNGTSFIELPANSYTILGDINNITFEAGEAIKEIKISVNQSLLDLTEAYALGFSIADAGTGVINTTLKDALYSIGIKNAYEGDYTTSGFVFHPSAPRALDDSKYLYTVSGTRCLAPLADLYPSGYYFWFDVSGTNTLTNWDCTPVAPPASGFFTADNPGAINYSAAAPDAPGTAPWLQTTYNNTYDPGTKTFWMHYGYGVGSSSQNGWTRNFYEKWVRQ
jgi:hypothetical protein